MRRTALSASTALIAMAISLGLIGCQELESGRSERGDASTASEAAPSPAGYSADMVAPEAPPPDVAPDVTPVPQDGGAPAATVPQLAYSYDYVVSLPTRSVRALAAQHEQACVQAGPQTCQIIGSATEENGNDNQTVRLELRATPQWLTTFRNGLAAQAEAADGEIARSGTQSEDLTRAIIDTEAHLRAKTALRDRLQIMLATRDGNLQSVLEVERELARVQGEIDSATATLQAMRARVTMSHLTMTYQSRGVLAPDSATAPLESALNGALGLFMSGLASIISVLAFVLPFLLVLGPLGWLIWRMRRRRVRPTAVAASPMGDTEN